MIEIVLSWGIVEGRLTRHHQSRRFGRSGFSSIAVSAGGTGHRCSYSCRAHVSLFPLDPASIAQTLSLDSPGEALARLNLAPEAFAIFVDQVPLYLEDL
jgi:hypothetical protein